MLQGSGQERKQDAIQPEELAGLKGLIAKLRWAGLDKDLQDSRQELL